MRSSRNLGPRRRLVIQLAVWQYRARLPADRIDGGFCSRRNPEPLNHVTSLGGDGQRPVPEANASSSTFADDAGTFDGPAPRPSACAGVAAFGEFAFGLPPPVQRAWPHAWPLLQQPSWHRRPSWGAHVHPGRRDSQLTEECLFHSCAIGRRFPSSVRVRASFLQKNERGRHRKKAPLASQADT